MAERAQARFAADGLSAGRGRCGGDMHRDPLPEGADLVTLVRVLHDHDDAAVRALLGRLRQAMPPGGTLLIAEPMAGLPGDRTDGRCLFRLLPAGHGQRPGRGRRQS